MRTTKRSIAALAVGLSLVLAACGGDDATETTEPSETTQPTETTGSTDTSAPAGDAAMRITYDIAEAAVWDDGTPIDAEDFICTYNAIMNTPGSLSTVGYDQIISIAAGTSDKQVVVEFSSVYAPYRGLFGGLIKHDAVADCNDVSGEIGRAHV